MFVQAEEAFLCVCASRISVPQKAFLRKRMWFTASDVRGDTGCVCPQRPRSAFDISEVVLETGVGGGAGLPRNNLARRLSLLLSFLFDAFCNDKSSSRAMCVGRYRVDM